MTDFSVIAFQERMIVFFTPEKEWMDSCLRRNDLPEPGGGVGRPVCAEALACRQEETGMTRIP